MLSFCSKGFAREDVRGVLIVVIILTTTYTLLSYQNAPLEDQRPVPWIQSQSPERYQVGGKFSPPILWTNNDVCRGYKKEDKTLVIILNAGRANFDRRQLIRQTWGSIRSHGGWTILPPIFMLGFTSPQEAPFVQENLEIERRDLDDLVMGDFLDTYRNLTLKTIMGYEWIFESCGNVRAIIKGDDDIVLNIFELIKLLNEHPEYLNSSNYYGDTHQGSGPVRDSNHRWFVSREDYPGDSYPRYCSGFGYLMTVKVVRKVLGELSNFEHRISMDDIFMAGIVPESYNLKLKTESQQKEKIERLHINGTWEFLSEQEPASVRLRAWYKGQVGAGDLDKDLRNPIFYIIQHGKMFMNDFLGTWDKIVGDLKL